MTERSPSIPTQIATPVQGAFRSSVSIPNDAIPAHETVDEEPYTIKCICSYNDDDGSTVYCDTCDTWQHIECYYFGQTEVASRPDFDHSCGDCKPRPLDVKGATERQRQHRQNKVLGSPEDKKSKRPPSKSHKKKVKPVDVQINGYHDHERQKNGSPFDIHPPMTKKPKGHRASQSMSAKRSPPLNTRPHTHAHPPSPAHTPPELPSHVRVHSYSDDFVSLYEDDELFQATKTNSCASLAVTNSMSSWIRDPATLIAEVGVMNRRDAIETLKVSPDTLSWPELRVETKEVKVDDTVLKWRSLVNTTDLHDSGRIGEINGMVGYQKDYCNDAANRWADYIHPRPFIFFPRNLPLFIDTRKEGSICRYVRRSCRPNSCLETFATHGSEYHFWIVSDRPLAANEQVTIPWEFVFPPNTRFLKLLNLGDGEDPSRPPTDITDEEYDQLASTIHLVLSDYGGCACELHGDCAFARFHRNYHGRSQNQSNGTKSKKGRKPKQNHVSPTSTGQATNSRAASEGQDQYDEDDGRSQSGSVKSKPHSRDLTPLHGISESNGLFTEPSDREKRKLAMLEDSFRKMEQQQPVRKKAKRASDTSTVNLPNGTTQTKGRKGSIAPRGSISQMAVPNGNGVRPRQYIDASTSGRQSGSPFSAISPTNAALSPITQVSPSHHPCRSRPASVAPRGVYVTTATQTDPVADAWWGPKPKPKRNVVPLAKRLMKNWHKMQGRIEAQTEAARHVTEEESLRASPAVSMDLDHLSTEERHRPTSPTDSRGRRASISSTRSADISGDVTMVDAPSIMASNLPKPPLPTWHGHAIISLGSGQNPKDLHVQMPTPPIFTTPQTGGAGSVPPSPAASTTAQSPFGTVNFPPVAYPQLQNGLAPVPAKAPKKLSLSEYNSRLKNSAVKKSSSGGSPPIAPAVLKAGQEIKMSGILEGSAIVDSPLATPDKTIDPLSIASVSVFNTKLN